MNMHDRGYGDEYPLTVLILYSFVHRQDDTEMFILVAQKHLVTSVCDERENSYPISGLVLGCWLGLIESGKSAEIF